MPLVETDADLSRIKSLIAQPGLSESGLLSRTVLAQANAILGELRPGERFATMTSITDKGLLIVAAMQSTDGRFSLAAHVKQDFVPGPNDTEFGLSLRYSF